MFPSDSDRSERQDQPATHGVTDAGSARSMLTQLPTIDYVRPPVVETVLGVQFAPLKSLTVAHLGLFWGEVRREYPQHEIQPPLAHEIEEFPRRTGSGSIELELTSLHEARCWFVDATSTQLIQVQRDRFVRNWRKRPAPDDVYPRYQNLRPKFEEDWLRFVSFLEREDLGRPNVDQCEVTYVNLIELAPGKSSSGDLDDMLTVFRKPERTFLPEPEALIFNALYPMPDRGGRLHVWGQPAIRRTDGAEVLQLKLTARGTPRSSKLEDIRGWFDLGHAWVVHGFTDLATPTMRKLWGQR